MKYSAWPEVLGQHEILSLAWSIRTTRNTQPGLKY